MSRSVIIRKTACLKNHHCHCTSKSGAHNRNRTDDLFLTKEVLYRLSYMGKGTSLNDSPARLERVMGIEPTSSAWKAEVLPLNYTRKSRWMHTGNLSPPSGPATSDLVEGGGFEPPKAEPSDLQSDPFSRSGTPPNERRGFSSKLPKRVNEKRLILTNNFPAATNPRQLRGNRKMTRSGMNDPVG